MPRSTLRLLRFESITTHPHACPPSPQCVHCTAPGPHPLHSLTYTCLCPSPSPPPASSQVCFACVEEGEFKLAQLCGLNIIVNADDLDEVSEFYQRRGHFDQLMSLMESGLVRHNATCWQDWNIPCHAGVVSSSCKTHLQHRTAVVLP